MLAILARWQWIAGGLVLLLVAFGGWRVHKLFTDAEKAAELQEQINRQKDRQRKSDDTGKRLETALESLKVRDHEIDTDSRVSAGSVQRIAERIGRGEAARERLSP